MNSEPDFPKSGHRFLIRGWPKKNREEVSQENRHQSSERNLPEIKVHSLIKYF